MNYNVSTFLLKQPCLNVQKLFHNSSYNLTSHYDTLKLQQSCTSKEIRESFLKLSKQVNNHPDVNKSPHAHNQFLKIQEAYNVLSKPSSRAAYDSGLHMGTRPGSANYTSYQDATGRRYTYYYTRQSSTRNPWDDPSFFHNRRGPFEYEKDSYYGVKGLRRRSNGTVVTCIIVFTTVMFCLQIFAIARAVSYQQHEMDKRSMAVQKTLNEVRERAERNGKQVQIEIHRQQFEELERLKTEWANKYK